MSHETETRSLELIGCDGCGRHFATDDGPGMIAVVVGPCPDCGGRFELVDAATDPASRDPEPLRARRESGPAARSPADPRQGRSASA